MPEAGTSGNIVAGPLNVERIALLNNPASGYNRRVGLDAVRKAAMDAGISSYDVTGTGDMEKTLAAIAMTEPDILAINAGDGTVDLVLTLMRTSVLFKVEPRILLLRGGTTNMIHGDCGPKARPAQALKNFMERGGGILSRQPLEIRRRNSDVLYGFFAGTGAIPKAIHAAKAGLHRYGLTGPVGEALIIMALLTRLKLRHALEKDRVLAPTPIGCTLDGDASHAPHIFMGITSLKTLIGKRATGAQDGKMAVLSMGEKRKLITRYATTLKLDIVTEWVLDGEFFPIGTIDIRLGAPVRFIGDPA